MKKTFRKLSSLLLALVMMLSMSATAFAATPSVTYEGGAEKFVFLNGSGYTDTDLFDNFKNVMPGDKLTQAITVKNNTDDCDYVKIYMRAVAHDENGNPLTYSESYENADGKDQAGIDGQRDETVATMNEFLAQLSMKIYDAGNLIYDSSPDETDGLRDKVLLGVFRKGESTELTVELDVPIELSNKYANRVGEVDWVFSVEEFDDPVPPPVEPEEPTYEKLTVQKVWQDDGVNRPVSAKVTLMRNGEAYETVELNEGCNWKYTWMNLASGYSWTVVEKDVPAGYEASYTTVTDTVTITNKKKAASLIDLNVIKAWSDNGKNRPASINVTLYSGETAVETVTLSAANKWAHTWKGLSSDGNWTVIETAVPKGYAPSYSRHGNTVLITNVTTLLQTGQLNWPIPVLLGAAVLLFVLGFVSKKRRKHV